MITHRKQQTHHARFTLIELLVVIAIISILSALLLPVVGKAKSQARYSRWLGHVKNMQADTATIAYYTFRERSGIVLKNIAAGIDAGAGYIPERYDGAIKDPDGPTWEDGRWAASTALRFDGVDDYVDVGIWDIGATDTRVDTMTIVVWFRAESFGTNDARLISKATGTDPDQHWFMLSTINSGPDIVLRARLKAGGSATTTLIATSGELDTNVWTFAAAVYDGAELKLYKDGFEVGVEAVTGDIELDNAIRVYIGSNTDSDKFFHGFIGEVCVLQRALSETEILNYFKMSRP